MNIDEIFSLINNPFDLIIILFLCIGLASFVLGIILTFEEVAKDLGKIFVFAGVGTQLLMIAIIIATNRNSLITLFKNMFTGEVGLLNVVILFFLITFVNICWKSAAKKEEENQTFYNAILTLPTEQKENLFLKLVAKENKNPDEITAFNLICDEKAQQNRLIS